MSFIKRDEQGNIVAVSAIAATDYVEVTADEAVELTHFLSSLDDDNELNQADLPFIRVLEDLMDVLMEKQVFLFTELPVEAQAKILKRQSLRRARRGALDILEENHEEYHFNIMRGSSRDRICCAKFR